MRKPTFALGLILAIVATVASASPLPPPGEVRTYFRDGVQVGFAIHNQCTGELRVEGIVTNDYLVGYVHC
jgi:hypothetical protein